MSKYYFRDIDGSLVTVRGQLLIVIGEPTAKLAQEVADAYMHICPPDEGHPLFFTCFKMPECFQYSVTSVKTISRNYHKDPLSRSRLGICSLDDLKLTRQELIKTIDIMTSWSADVDDCRLCSLTSYLAEVQSRITTRSKAAALKAVGKE